MSVSVGQARRVLALHRVAVCRSGRIAANDLADERVEAIGGPGWIVELHASLLAKSRARIAARVLRDQSALAFSRTTHARYVRGIA